VTDFVVEPRRQVIDVLEQPPRVLDDSLAVDNRFRGHPGTAVLPMWSIRVVYSSTIGAMRSRPARKRLLRSGSWSAIAIGVSSIEYRTGNIGKIFWGLVSVLCGQDTAQTLLVWNIGIATTETDILNVHCSSMQYLGVFFSRCPVHVLRDLFSAPQPPNKMLSKKSVEYSESIHHGFLAVVTHPWSLYGLSFSRGAQRRGRVPPVRS
jgi:hypothetical protein